MCLDMICDVRFNSHIDATSPSLLFQLDAALTMDAATVIVEGLNAMLKEDSEVFRNTFRRGQVYNNGSRGVQCKGDPPVPWKHGSALMKSFKQVKPSSPSMVN